MKRGDGRVQREIERLAEEGMKELKKRKVQEPSKADQVEDQPRVDQAQDEPMPAASSHEDPRIKTNDEGTMDEGGQGEDSEKRPKRAKNGRSAGRRSDDDIQKLESGIDGSGKAEQRITESE